jgi:hypothetical protein
VSLSGNVDDPGRYLRERRGCRGIDNLAWAEGICADRVVFGGLCRLYTLEP